MTRKLAFDLEILRESIQSLHLLLQSFFEYLEHYSSYESTETVPFSLHLGMIEWRVWMFYMSTRPDFKKIKLGAVLD